LLERPKGEALGYLEAKTTAKAKAAPYGMTNEKAKKDPSSAVHLPTGVLCCEDCLADQSTAAGCGFVLWVLVGERTTAMQRVLRSDAMSCNVPKSCYMEGKFLPTGEGNCLATRGRFLHVA
jgi:hypothetical protein